MTCDGDDPIGALSYTFTLSFKDGVDNDKVGATVTRGLLCCRERTSIEAGHQLMTDRV